MTNMDTPPEHREQIEQLKGADILDINDLISIRDQLNNDSLDIQKDDLLAISKKLLTHSFEIQKLDLNKKSLITKNNIGKIELESLKRQAEALSWKLERSRWDARLTRWEAHDEVEPQGTSILHQDIETENRMLVGDKRVLKTKVSCLDIQYYSLIHMLARRSSKKIKQIGERIASNKSDSHH